MCFLKLKKVHLLVSELYIYQNAWRKNKNCSDDYTFFSHSAVYYNTIHKHVGACVSLSNSIVI